MRLLPARSALLAAVVSACSANAAAEPFVFRGALDDGQAPAEGRYALRLTLYASPQDAVPLGGPLELLGVPVSAGRFAVDADFGALPPYAQGWLEVAAKADGEADYTPLGGRMPVDLKAGTTCPAAWALGGNALTNPAVDFVGTTDAQPLELRADLQRVARFEAQIVDGGSTANVVLGSAQNRVAPGVRGATIAGGGVPNAFDDPVFGRGLHNSVDDTYGTVGGGNNNHAGSANGIADAAFATVAGGFSNTASARAGTVSGGSLNEVRSSGASVGGGNGNSALGSFATVGGGIDNSALGNAATVGGGRLNCAGGDTSWAGGRRAKIRPAAATGNLPGEGCDDLPGSGLGDNGTFLWADSQDTDFFSTGRDQFGIRARGGVRLTEDTSQYFGAATRQMLNLHNQNYGIGVQSSTLYQRSNTQFAWFRDGVHSDGALDPGAGGALLMTLGTNTGTPVGIARAQQFVNVSDRHAKTAFAPVDAIDVLARVLELPVSRWSYKTGAGERHLGPMAQDFHAAFGLGGDDRTIATVDADGVALAAIQGLNAKLEAENAALQAQDEALREALDALRAELAALRRRLDRSSP